MREAIRFRILLICQNINRNLARIILTFPPSRRLTHYVMYEIILEFDIYAFRIISATSDILLSSRKDASFVGDS